MIPYFNPFSSAILTFSTASSYFYTHIFYLSRIFQEQTGATIANFAIWEKIKKAKRLIRENGMNFAQISDSLSFDNPQYFSRVFKRITGMTPTEFKSSLNFEN